MRNETESQWQANLEEARERLSVIRETLISSWLMIHSTDDKDERKIFGGDWGEAVREEIELTKKVIAPAKIKLGLPLTNRSQERSVIRTAKKISQRYGGTYKQGESVVKKHIRLTKRIQERAGLM